MIQLPSIELLESAHSFPGPYEFKVIGKAEEGFLGRVLATVRLANQMEQDPVFSLRQTPDGKHLSVSLTIEAQSAQRVHSIYKELGTLEGLILLI